MEHLRGLRYAVLSGLLAVFGCTDTFDPGKGPDGGGLLCQPGEGKCEGQVPLLCGDDGMRWEKQAACTWPESCNAGACTDPCSLAKANRSYVGCEYFAVDLDNVPTEQGYSAEDAQFAIVVSYAGATEHAVGVKIYSKVGGTEKVVAEGDVFPGGVKVFKVGPQNIKGTFQGMQAFRVSAAAPVTVYQFNPLNNTQEAFSNDASLLLPVPSLDKDYIAVTGDGIMVADTYNQLKAYKMGSFVTVVGVTDGTKVTITPSAPIVAGAGLPGGKAPITKTLNRYEVLSVSSEVSPTAIPKPGDSNLSGTMVQADKPVAVFAGNGATVTPTGPTQKCCADHLEEQMIPLSAWGKVFVAARTRPRKLSGTAELDWWSITGGAQAIKLTYAPSTPAGAPTELDKGQSVAFSSSDSFVVKASGPILVTQFMTSANHTGDISGSCSTDDQCTGLAFEAACHKLVSMCSPVGDPAMTLIPPVEQFRSDYVFLVPDDYFKDYATFIVPMGTSITLDDKAIGQQASGIGEINGTQYGLMHVPLSDGKHRASASKPFGVLAYGVDCHVSYGYPAGMDLKQINIQ